MLFVAEQPLEAVRETARAIWQTERQQAAAIKAGKTLREQLHFNAYLAKRDTDPDYTFRKHLRTLGGAIEEQHFLYAAAANTGLQATLLLLRIAPEPDQCLC